MSSILNEVSIRKIIPPIYLPILLLVLVPTILGQDYSKGKSYKEWSEKECREMLENSPWSRDFTVTDVVIMGTSDRTLSDSMQP